MPCACSVSGTTMNMKRRRGWHTTTTTTHQRRATIPPIPLHLYQQYLFNTQTTKPTCTFSGYCTESFLSAHSALLLLGTFAVYSSFTIYPLLPLPAHSSSANGISHGRKGKKVGGHKGLHSSC